MKYKIINNKINNGKMKDKYLKIKLNNKIIKFKK